MIQAKTSICFYVFKSSILYFSGTNKMRHPEMALLSAFLGFSIVEFGSRMWRQAFKRKCEIDFEDKLMLWAKEFFERLGKEYKKSPIPGGYRKWRFWTKVNLKLLENFGKKFGYDVWREKPTRIDMTWFDPRYFEPQVAIEYETNEKTVLDSELKNLACSSARLKVLITYSKERTQHNMLQQIKARWTKRSKRIWNDELLILFIIFHPEKGYRVFDYFEGHVIYPFKGNLRVKDLGSFPMYI